MVDVWHAYPQATEIKWPSYLLPQIETVSRKKIQRRKTGKESTTESQHPQCFSLLFHFAFMSTSRHTSDQACSTINKNPETNIGIQAEDQKSKPTRHWFLPLPQSKMVILPSGILRMRLRLKHVFFHLIFPWIQGSDHWVSSTPSTLGDSLYGYSWLSSLDLSLYPWKCNPVGSLCPARQLHQFLAFSHTFPLKLTIIPQFIYTLMAFLFHSTVLSCK